MGKVGLVQLYVLRTLLPPSVVDPINEKKLNARAYITLMIM